ncbi:MAG: hypothetical protein WD278_03530, partial [Pirellulales bacterium]
MSANTSGDSAPRQDSDSAVAARPDSAASQRARDRSRFSETGRRFLPRRSRNGRSREQQDEQAGADLPSKGLARSHLRTAIAVCSSMLVHLALILALGLAIMPEAIQPVLPNFMATLERPQELVNQVVDVNLDPTSELALVSSSPVSTSSTAGGGLLGISKPTYDHALSESQLAPKVNVGDLSDFSMPGNHFGMELPQGTLGEPQAVVDDYQQAMDRITQEILNMLVKNKVLVIWCFDQSESMKDDQ